MEIGIIGAGAVAQTVAKSWVKRGHAVTISSRNPEKIENLRETIGVETGTVEEAAKFGEVLFIAVNYSSIDSAIERIRPFVAGKLVIDATNPLVMNDSGEIVRVIADDLIAGEVTQEKLKNARIAKAFTTLWTGHLENHANASPRIAMTLAADEESDRNLVAQLIEDTGFEPVSLGTLADSRLLDPPSPIWNVVLTSDEMIKHITAFRNA